MVYNKICMGASREKNLQPLTAGADFASSKSHAGERRGRVMNCKETEKKIPSFLNDELDGRGLAEFVEHIEDCPECMEELSIQFLVSEGMEQLEQGNNFNLLEALTAKLENADYRIRLNRALRHILFVLEAAVVAAIIAAVIIVSM